MAKQNFTARFLDSVKTEKVQEDFWDQKTPGFGVRVSRSGRKTWFYYFRLNGRKKRLNLGTYPALGLHEARQMVLDVQKDIYQGNDPTRTQAEILFKDLASKFMNEYAKVQKRSWKEDERNLKNDVLPAIGNLSLTQITKRDIVLMLDKISFRGVGVHTNRILALVRRIFNYGIEKDLLESNPCSTIRKPHKEISRDRVLNEDEITNLWQALESIQRDSRNLLKIMILTAQRSKEVKHMRWQDLDLKEMVWTIPGEFTKNGKSNRVPITSLMKQIIEEQTPYRFKSIWAFPCRRDAKRPYQSHQKAIQQLKALSGIDFRGHDLRRTAATHMAILGTTRLTISKLLNHSDGTITGVYDRHSYDSEKMKALESWGTWLIGLADEKRPRTSERPKNSG